MSDAGIHVEQGSGTGELEVLIDPGPSGTAIGIGGGGPPGDSAYKIAVQEGFVGTRAEWLASMEGTKLHDEMDNRELDDAHPISSITGLSDSLDDEATARLTGDEDLQEEINTVGGVANSALQPDDVGTAALEGVEAFASAAQGDLANTSLQSVSVVPDGGIDITGTAADPVVSVTPKVIAPVLDLSGDPSSNVEVDLSELGPDVVSQTVFIHGAVGTVSIFMPAAHPGQRLGLYVGQYNKPGGRTPFSIELPESGIYIAAYVATQIFVMLEVADVMGSLGWLPSPHNQTIEGNQITSGRIDPARLPIGDTPGTVAAGDDGRFTDARTPTAHDHPIAQVTGLVDALSDKLSMDDLPPPQIVNTDGDPGAKLHIGVTPPSGPLLDGEAWLDPSDTPADHVYAKVKFENLTTVPAGPNEVGEVATVNGKLMVCTTAGSPGVWVQSGPFDGPIWVMPYGLRSGQPSGAGTGNGGSGSFNGVNFTVNSWMSCAYTVPDHWPTVQAYMWWTHDSPVPDPTLSIVLYASMASHENAQPGAGRAVSAMSIGGAGHTSTNAARTPLTRSLPQIPGSGNFWTASFNNRNDGSFVSGDKIIVAGFELQNGGPE